MEKKWRKLREENKQSREEIKKRDIQIEKLFDDNEHLKKNNEQFKKDYKELKNEYLIIHDKITQMETDKLFNKYVMAFQDLNRVLKLETILNSKQTLRKPRKNRVSECHYLDEEDEKTEQDEKIYVLYQKICNIPEQIKNIFDKRYPDIIKEIVSVMPNIKIEMTKETEEEINMWWN